MPLRSDIEFGSSLQYAVRATDPEVRRLSFRLRDAIKKGHDPLFNGLANHLAANPDTDAQVCELFGPQVVLVPAPGSAVTKPSSLWVPKRICEAFLRAGLVSRVEIWLTRITAVPKSAYAKAEHRPNTHRHFETIEAQRNLEAPERIIVVDDVVTSGATLLACVSLLADAFPRSQVRAFALARAISGGNITNTHAPVRAIFVCGVMVRRGGIRDAFLTCSSRTDNVRATELEAC